MFKQQPKKAKAKKRLKTFVNGKGAIQAEVLDSENKYDFRDDAFALNDVPYDEAMSVHFKNLINTWGEAVTMKFIRDVYLDTVLKYLVDQAPKKKPSRPTPTKAA